MEEFETQHGMKNLALIAAGVFVEACAITFFHS